MRVPSVTYLQARLEARADPATREWWERYLKGAARFRGVPTAAIRDEAARWWDDARADDLPPDAQLDICLALLACPFTEDKLAGMLLLGERLIPDGRVACPGVLPRFARLYADGHLADWNAVDWFCVRVLGPLITVGGEDCARAIAAWVESDGTWQRRSALVAFVDHARAGRHATLIEETAARLVRYEERFAQTAVGWTIRELGRAEPDLAAAFLDRHRDAMSAEARRQATTRRQAKERR